MNKSRQSELVSKSALRVNNMVINAHSVFGEYGSLSDHIGGDRQRGHLVG